QIDEACKRNCRHAALAAVKALPRAAQHRILIYRQRRVRSAVFVPVAMVCMVIVMMLGPNVLRHPGQDPEHKPNLTIQPTAAEQAAMAALVHQAEGAHDEENDEWQREQGEPAGDFSATDSAPQEKCDRDQGR